MTTSDDNTIRVWRFDPTAETRKQLGRSDISCNISGTAQRTHREYIENTWHFDFYPALTTSLCLGVCSHTAKQ